MADDLADDVQNVLYYYKHEDPKYQGGALNACRAELFGVPDEKTKAAKLRIHFQNRREIKSDVPFGPQKAGCWGWNDIT